MLNLIHRVVLWSVLLCPGIALADESILSRIAFGSCARQNQPQPIWDAVIATKPQLFLFLGDNIYGDSEDMAVLQAKYEMLGQQPGYQMLKQTCPILATWDDHDFGKDDAGSDYKMRRESQQIFMDFFEVPPDDDRRKREGIYVSRVFGPQGKRVQIILLDARYFRSPLKTGFMPGERGEGRRGKYLPIADANTTILGEAQWKWLEAQLKIPADIRIIGSGTQVITDDHNWEAWSNFPHERERLFKLIKQTRANGVIFISGDRHLAEISRLNASDPVGVGYPLFDITSSSLNAPSGNMTGAKTRFANQINVHRVGLVYFEVNFGTILIDWDKEDPIIRAQVRDLTGDVVLQQRVRLSELRPG